MYVDIQIDPARRSGLARSRRDKDMSDNKAIKQTIRVLKKVTVTFLSYDL
jgi:hypothetical protein